MRRRRRLVLFVLTVVVILSSDLAVGIGALELSFLDCLAYVLAPPGFDAPWITDDFERNVLWNLRMPRVALGLCVGAVLAVSGAVMQGLFRNPLAEPGLLGVSSGAALAAATVIVLGGDFISDLPHPYGQLVLPFAAFFGGAICTYLVYGVSLNQGRLSISTMLLAGIAFNAIGFSMLGFLQYIADDGELRSLTFWMLGNLGDPTWNELSVVAPLLLVTLLGAYWLARPLNCFLLGEVEAMHLGVPIQWVNRIAIFLVALGVGVCVSMTGMIGFIGLVTPHLIRLAVSPDHRIVIPGAALLGAALLVSADAVARTAVAPAELPVGILTTMIGAPFFLFLLIRARQ